MRLLKARGKGGHHCAKKICFFTGDFTLSYETAFLNFCTVDFLCGVEQLCK